MRQATIALVITQPGPLRNSLITLLSTMPEIEIVAEGRELSTLERINKELQPDLIVLEADAAGKGLPEALQHINRVWRNTRAIVLVDSNEQQQQAAAAGADAVFLKGFRAANLVQIIEEFLQVSGPERIN